MSLREQKEHGLNPYLIRPHTLCSTKATHTAAHFHILMGGIHLPQTGTDVRDHPAQHLSTEDHPRASHAEVLSGL